MKVAYLIPEKNTRLRLGKFGLDETFEYIPSDTLFAGLLNSVAILYGEGIVDKFLTAAQDGDLRVSSAFPLIEVYADNNLLSDWLFLPKPLIGFGKPAEESEVQKKFVKKVKYVEASLLIECLNSIEETDGFLRSNLTFSEEKILPLFGMFALKKDDLLSLAPIARIKREERKEEVIEDLKKVDSSPFISNPIPRVTIDRLTSSSGIYSETDLFLLKREFKISRNSQLTFQPSYFFFYQVTRELERQLNGALNLLIDEGIGGKRSQGSGKFKEVKYSDVELKVKGDKYSINLSLLFPGKTDLQSAIAYELILRGGFITSKRGTQYLKKSVRMMKEGSVFKGVPQGSLPKVSDEKSEKALGHSVYQYGLNFPLTFGG
jgi:CRISPR-associated protein Csm4